LLAVAGLHVVLGVVAGRARLGSMLERGWNGLGNAAAEERLAFWFVIAGLFLAVVGMLVDAVEAQGARLPAIGACLLLALAVTGVVLEPFSGFWLLLPPAVGWLARNRGVGAASNNSMQTDGAQRRS
jgi:hypothetical protein